MNKNIIIVGAMAVGLYLLLQEKKITKAVSKKKAPQKRRPKPDIPDILRPRPKTAYNKPKIKRVIAKKKAVYNKPKIKKATTRKKSTYYQPKPRVAIARKQQIKRMLWRKRRR